MAAMMVYADNNCTLPLQQDDITDSIEDLSAFQYHFDNKISSVRVKSGTFTLFTNKKWGGASVTVSAHGGPNSDGIYPTHQWLGEQGDKFSSIRKNAEEG